MKIAYFFINRFRAGDHICLKKQIEEYIQNNVSYYWKFDSIFNHLYQLCIRNEKVIAIILNENNEILYQVDDANIDDFLNKYSVLL